MNNGRRNLLCLGVSSLAFITLANSAQAQVKSPGREQTNVIEELVITAEMSEKSLQDVAVAVSAFTAA